MRSALLALLISSIIQAWPLLAEDWPQWRGPERTDVSHETDLMEQWPDGGPPRVWLYRDAGAGYSGPAIVDRRLFTMGDRDGTTFLIALDAESGQELWTTPLGEAYRNSWGNGPRSTPTVDDGFVYALSARGALVCAAVDDGAVRWRRNLVDDFRGRIPRWGFSESLLVDGVRVVATPGSADAAVVAMRKNDGSVLWKSECDEPAQYASIMPAEIDGRRQYIQLFMKRLVGIAADDGSTLWETDFPGKIAVVPTPIVRDNQIYVSAGYGVGCMMVEIDDDRVTEVYRNKAMKNHHGGVILLGDHLFGHSDPSGWLCQDFATGKPVWRARKPLGKGAIAYADGHFYCLDEDSGELALIAASTEGWKEKGRFVLDPQTEIRKPQGRIWTHPVISNGRLYLRDQDLIYCFDVRQSEIAAR